MVRNPFPRKPFRRSHEHQSPPADGSGELPVETDHANVNLLWVGLIFEGALFFAGLLLGWLGWHAAGQSVLPFDWQWGNLPGGGRALIWRCLLPASWATIPLLVYLGFFHWLRDSWFAPMTKFVRQELAPMFASSTTFELLLLSLMAGLGEELFFRWALQGGLAAWLGGFLAGWKAQAIAIVTVSALFGLCHWVNHVYGITTFLAGIYLGVVMIVSEHWLIPALAHAAFDFAALIYIVRSHRGR